MEQEKLRLDKYLWAIRIFKTRTLAAKACADNKVLYNGQPAKASKNVSIGDVYEIKAKERKWHIEVTGLLHQRRQYSEAINFYIDHTLKKKSSLLNRWFPHSTQESEKARLEDLLKKTEET